MNCGCESGKGYEYHWECPGCMARHYVNVLAGATRYNVELRKSRYKQLQRAWPAEKFAEWWKEVERLRKR